MKESDVPPQSDPVASESALLRSILETVPDAMIVIDELATVQFFSSAAERLFGYTANEVRGQNVRMLMPPPYREQHDGYLTRYRRTGERRIIGIGRVVVGPAQGRQHLPDGAVGRRGEPDGSAPVHRFHPRPHRATADQSGGCMNCRTGCCTFHGCGRWDRWRPHWRMS